MRGVDGLDGCFNAERNVVVDAELFKDGGLVAEGVDIGSSRRCVVV